MILDVDETSGKVSAQFPDVHISLYPAGSRVTDDGKEQHYRGALVLARGSERIHLNALDIADVETFLSHRRVLEARQVMTKEHVASNLLRSLLTINSLDDKEIEL